MSAILNSLRNLASSSRASSAGETDVRFGVSPGAAGSDAAEGEGGYAEWLHAMRLVARLPAGVPQHFRRKLWLTLADRHLTARGIEWLKAERACFRGTAQPDDTELGAQIIKDLHRTGCSLFCGTEGRENQAMLRRVLLAYARWNKEVGYCQGFNMLAAIILEVMEKSESDSLKVMIYLVEAVLPEGYFADDLRGLSADMAAFRDLMRLRLPRLASHMDHLQRISDGGGVEPPLPDVFTMQWFLTLYATWLPRESLLRIWDLILLDGNEVLLLTALAIWDMLQDRILSSRSADEFYSCMGGGAGAVWQAGEGLVARVVAFGSAPELPRLRNLHRYRVTPPAPPTNAPVHSAMQSMTKRGLRLFYSEDEGDSSDDGNKMALATFIPRREDRMGAGDRLSLDIGALKRQYARLRERQRQAHVILAAACARHAAVGVPTSPTSLTVNNLLLGKSAIVSSRGRRLGPPPGAIPPSRQTSIIQEKPDSHLPGKSSETISWTDESNKKKLSRRNSLKWKDIKKEKTLPRGRKTSIDLDEAGDGIIVSEHEANEMIASVRLRSSSESSTYSSHSASSSDTSLCDENERASDSEPELTPDNTRFKINKTLTSPSIRILRDELPNIKESKISDIRMYPDDSKCTNQVQNISEYLHTAAGEPLRTYIDGFDTKLEKNLSFASQNDVHEHLGEYKKMSLFSPNKRLEECDKLITLSQSQANNINYRSNDSIHTKKVSHTSKNFTDLSPIDISTCGFDIDSLVEYQYNPNLKDTFDANITKSRTPDIIDSFAMYPNFVPDIELSDKNTSDFESPPRSPDAESIVVSEDEPPIPLKIDKYFEHSPEFFGARVTDPNNSDIPNRRPAKRLSRQPKKPDSLTLQCSHSDKMLEEEIERASSLPQSHSFTSLNNIEEKTCIRDPIILGEIESICSYDNDKNNSSISRSPTLSKEHLFPKDSILQSGRKNSERALQIIQENSKILNRILTKQNSTKTKTRINELKESDSLENKKFFGSNTVTKSKPITTKSFDSALLRESTSDSLIGHRKRRVNHEEGEKNNFIRMRPISIDDPFSLDIRKDFPKSEEFSVNNVKLNSSERLGNKTDNYGWENKGFVVKDDCRGSDSVKNVELVHNNSYDSSTPTNFTRNAPTPRHPMEWNRQSLSNESLSSMPIASGEPQNTSSCDYRFTKSDYDYPLSIASGMCSKGIDQTHKLSDVKTDVSHTSDFTHVVTSSISFTYEPSVEDDSPIGCKSNSSDTLCQITSLDQVSTPMSPKIFPRDTPTLLRDIDVKTDTSKLDSDDTCSAITSLIETDTLSSLSYPRSPSTGTYHPFPTRPPMRMPKELTVKLGMYPKDTISSPPK